MLAAVGMLPLSFALLTMSVVVTVQLESPIENCKICSTFFHNSQFSTPCALSVARLAPTWRAMAMCKASPARSARAGVSSSTAAIGGLNFRKSQGIGHKPVKGSQPRRINMSGALPDRPNARHLGQGPR